jgi:hypothetical protein
MAKSTFRPANILSALPPGISGGLFAKSHSVLLEQIPFEFTHNPRA